MATFTRASKATYIHKDTGILTEAQDNEPRFEREGILIEGASTNLMHGSNNPQFSLNHAGQEYIRKEMNCPDGVTRELRGVISEDEILAPSWYYWVPSAKFNGKVRVTFSSYIILNSHTGVSRIDAAMRTNVSGHMIAITSYDVLTGTVSDIGHEVTSTWEKLSDTMYKASLTYTPEDISAEGEILVSMVVRTESAQTELYSFGWQVEELPFASSYIPTNGTAVTRADDALSISTDSMTLDGSPFTYSMDFDMHLMHIYSNVLFVADADDDYEFMYLASSYTKPVWMSRLGEGRVDIPVEGIEKGRVSTTYDGDVLSCYMGGSVYSSVIGKESASVVNSINIGSRGISDTSIFGHVKNLRIWNHALTAEQIATL